MRYLFLIPVIFLSVLILPVEIRSQDWEFVKEKDGIKIFTRLEPGNNFKSFKGELEISAEVSEVCSLIEDVERFVKWDEDVRLIKVLEHEPGEFLKYYVIYDVPWPFKDRDLCVETHITSNQLDGSIFLKSRPIPDAYPPGEDCVRITNYWQNWMIQPTETGMVRIILEGYADPSGDIPAWIANLAITDTPLSMLIAIREEIKN